MTATKHTESFRHSVRRIQILTVCIGLGGAICAGIARGGRMGLAVAIGAAFSWVNFRWLKGGVDTIARFAIAQSGAEKVVVPRRIYFKLFGLFAVIILGAYAILGYSEMPLAGVLAGFFAAVVAVLVEAVVQILRGLPMRKLNS
jgi:hypothetical protein